MSEINHLTDLVAWKKSYQLGIDIYSITKTFPKEELFGLTNQLRRAVISISSNIAEGFARHSEKDKYHFCAIASGSACEVESQLRIAFGVGYLSKELLDELLLVVQGVQKVIAGLAKASHGILSKD